jgi:hypothetical protein
MRYDGSETVLLPSGKSMPNDSETARCTFGGRQAVVRNRMMKACQEIGRIRT